MNRRSKRVARWLFFIIFLLTLELLPGPARLSAQNVNLGMSFADGKLLGFYFSISKYFNVPSEKVIDIRNRYRLADDDLPVVFFIARQARVEPAVIIDLRLKGMSWWDISVQFGLNPEIFFVPVRVTRVGPPYGKAYGYYRRYHGQKNWGKVILSDDDIINLVNLKFISEAHQAEPERVMKLRTKGQRFVDIHDTIQMEKRQGRGQAGEKKTKPEKTGKGKNK
ncbi:MAG TPA: hypothetical protein PLP57_02790 [Candidatus Saccharicenans sp.]|jgi:hypothetical protein|nr:hypothetical protein [Candidatus Saccharicenans sp.]HRD01555.1 hypothetical protein [Candidatus Saccharicenans sp.]